MLIHDCTGKRTRIQSNAQEETKAIRRIDLAISPKVLAQEQLKETRGSIISLQRPLKSNKLLRPTVSTTSPAKKCLDLVEGKRCRIRTLCCSFCNSHWQRTQKLAVLSVQLQALPPQSSQDLTPTSLQHPHQLFYQPRGTTNSL